MPRIEEKLEPKLEKDKAQETLEGGLDELAQIETEFVDFVLPWLKLVPKDCCTKSSKVCTFSVTSFLQKFGFQGKCLINFTYLDCQDF